MFERTSHMIKVIFSFDVIVCNSCAIFVMFSFSLFRRYVVSWLLHYTHIIFFEGNVHALRLSLLTFELWFIMAFLT